MIQHGSKEIGGINLTSDIVKLRRDVLTKLHVI
jgi:hypothetical protein